MPAPLWNPASDGWYSADLHSHLNYGGPYLLTPEDIVLDMRGEALDLATPQLANLHTRFIDTEWWNWRRTDCR
jgi:TolB protein